MTKLRNEAETRAELIDPKLTTCGWQTGGKVKVHREYIITAGKIQAGGKRGKYLWADYALEYQGKVLAVIEAKDKNEHVTTGLEQAKKYAICLQCRLVYATNGKEIYQYDMHTGKQQLVDAYLSPEALWQLTYNDNTNIDAWRKRFADISYATNSNQRPRYYQKNAIENVLNAIMQGKDRILLTLATGTGKTFIACQLAHKLFHARWSKAAQQDISQAKRQPRILFLADRNILADQAFNAFFPFSDDAKVRIDPSEIKKQGKVPKNAAIFFTIFQTFMSGKDANGDPEPYFGDYPTDFFDFIIIDECHRGGANDYSSWRAILDYFAPAIQLGLTATPKRKGNTDTYDYFGEPVYTYSLKDGINDGFLTPYKLLPITGTMDEYTYDPNDGYVVEGNPEPGQLYKEADFNKTITIPQREQKRVQTWMNHFNTNDKTLVFCASQKHAAMVRDFINEYAYEKGWKTNEDYCVRVTADDGEIGEQFLRTFQDNEKTIPTILTTSRKLSTGVDARNVRNIVLMRPCKDMIEFKQIIGRGTRVYEDKSYFTIYDFVKAAENFNDPEWDGEPLPTPGSPSFTPLPSNKCIICGQRPCICNLDDKVKIDLHDYIADKIAHIHGEAQWEHNGRLIGVTEVIELLITDFPSIVANKNEFCQQWQDYNKRQILLDDFATKGYDLDKLNAIKQHAKLTDCDIYDVLLSIGYNIKPISRQSRVTNSLAKINQAFPEIKQQEFINFILEKYIADGEADLQLDKLNSLIKLKYKTTHDAKTTLNMESEAIKELFLTMQKYLYFS